MSRGVAPFLFGGSPRGTEDSPRFFRAFRANQISADRGKPLSGTADVPTCPNERVRRGVRPNGYTTEDRVSLTDLASVLWRSRELLEMLLFKLEE